MKAKVIMKAAQIFHDKQIPVMMKKYKVDDLSALEGKLQEQSMSIHALKKQFTERVLASELERKYVPEEYEFSRAELWAYCQDHASELDVSPRAKWRELCVRFNKRSWQEAEALIKDLGNQVYLGGKPFDAVAKQQSEGFTAAEGGIFDWTTQGSLKSAAIDEAVFSLPMRRLSQVIESEDGFHIIEVLEREPDFKKFDAAQADIRKRMSREKRSKLLDVFHAKIIAKTSIWTLWPQDIPNSRSLAERQTPTRIGESRLLRADVGWANNFVESDTWQPLVPSRHQAAATELIVHPRLRNWKVRLVEASTGNPVPGIKIRVQSLAEGHKKAQPIKATSDAEGIAHVEVVAGAPARVEVVSTNWWQVAQTLLDEDLISKTADSEGEKSQIIDINLNRGQPIELPPQRAMFR